MTLLETQIHPTAVVHPSADLGPGTRLGPYAVVEANTVIGAGTQVGAGAVIGPNTHLGRNNVIYNHASVGADPQDLSYTGEETYLVMGDSNRVREFVTVNRGTSKGDGYTRIGTGNLLMACSHVAHDCLVGDRVVLANNALLAGHVIVEDLAIVNGGAGIQQFTTIGTLSYVGGLTRIVHDVPPYMVVEGNPSKVRKVNTVGLQRHGFTERQVAALKEAHRKIFRSRRPQAEIIAELEQAPELTPEVAELCRFLRRMGHGARGRFRGI